MGMDGTFVSEFKGALHHPEKITVNGKERLIAPAHWQDITPGRADVKPMQVATLKSLLDYLAGNVDQLARAELMLHVTDATTVALRARLEDEDTKFRRHTYVVATAEPAKFPFGAFVDAETFVIQLQTCFVETKERAELLTLVGSIRESGVKDTTDDGYAQKVNVAQGVVLVGERRVPNPVVLAPYRTFREVEQPPSPFVLRLQSGKDGEKPRVALFEADGGTWKLEAVSRVAQFLLLGAAAVGTTDVLVLA